MVARRRKWEVKKKQRYVHQKSTLLGEIHSSQKAVKHASFGRAVVEMDESHMTKYRIEEICRMEKEKTKRLELIELGRKRRGGVKNYDLGAADVFNPSAFTIANDPYPFSVADKIKAFRSKTGEELAKKAEIRKRVLNKMSTVKDSTAKDVANIIQKNVHISKHDNKSGKQRKMVPTCHLFSLISRFASIATKIRSNLKNMKRLDLQEVLNYVPGTAVYFGATVAFQVTFAIHMAGLS
jgi:hypothetical protein